MTEDNPLSAFKQKLVEFATGKRRGIRNPFVIVPVHPAYEQAVAQQLAGWQPGRGASVTPIYLDRVMPQTDVFQTVLELPDSFFQDEDGSSDAQTRAESEEVTLRENLATEMVDHIVKTRTAICDQPSSILLLLHLGALYPFARASALLDELDRLRVQATVGIPFPGRVIGGKLSFFGEEAQHYYPAHRVNGPVDKSHLSQPAIGAPA